MQSSWHTRVCVCVCACVQHAFALVNQELAELEGLRARSTVKRSPTARVAQVGIGTCCCCWRRQQQQEVAWHALGAMMSTAMRLLHTALEQHLGDVVLAGVARHVQQGLAIDQLVDMVRGQVLFDLSLIGALDGLLDGANVSRLAEESQFRKTTRDQRTHRSCYNGWRSRRPRATSKTRETTAIGCKRERERESKRAGRRGTAERTARRHRQVHDTGRDRSIERERASEQQAEREETKRSIKQTRCCCSRSSVLVVVVSVRFFRPSARNAGGRVLGRTRALPCS